MTAFIRVIALALALAGSSARSPHPSESARNQYEAREDKPKPQLLTEATDHRPGVHMSQQGGFIKNSTNSSKQLTAPDLQVGCGDGFIQEKLQENSEVDKNKVSETRKSRRRRSYSPWSNSGQVVYKVAYPSISVWRPPVYQLSRPYYIPIYGQAGRNPIYFPPQPLFINPGAPKDNPVKRPFKGPTYLPPTPPTYLPPTPPTPTSDTTMTVAPRFNGGDNEEPPVWDMVENQPTRRPQATTEVIPTRVPMPPGGMGVPPLIHNPTDPEGFSNVRGEEVGQEQEISLNENDKPPAPPAFVSRPPQQNPPPARRPNEPSRCVWAIISCCSSNRVSYDCFEQRGCPGAFWDNNPCDSEFANAAISSALNYYNEK